MKNRKRLLALFLSGAMALSLFACGPAESTESPSAGPEASGDPDASATPEIEADLSQSALEFSAGVSPTDILLTVNGEEVQADVVCYLLGQYLIQQQYFYMSIGLNLTDMLAMAGDMLDGGVEWSVYHTIVRQKAAELGCLLTDSQAAEVKEALENPELEISTAMWDLTDQGIRFIFELNPYYDNLLAAVIHEPDGQELKEYLDAQGVFRVKHILLKTTDDENQPLSDSEIAGKKALADDLLAQLQAAEDMPAKFDELMNAHSDDGGLAANPDGYVFDSTNSLVGGFREAALELEEGQLSGIVETDYGYHIMLRLPLTDDTKEEYREEFRQEAFEDQMDRWISEAEVVRSDALSNLDVLDFYARLSAYQAALAGQHAAGDGAG